MFYIVAWLQSAFIHDLYGSREMDIFSLALIQIALQGQPTWRIFVRLGSHSTVALVSTSFFCLENVGCALVSAHNTYASPLSDKRCAEESIERAPNANRRATNVTWSDWGAACDFAVWQILSCSWNTSSGLRTVRLGKRISWHATSRKFWVEISGLKSRGGLTKWKFYGSVKCNTKTEDQLTSIFCLE